MISLKQKILFLVCLAGLASCGGSSNSSPAVPAAQRSAHIPSVVEVVGHYAEQMAQGTRLLTPASRSYADSVPSRSTSNSFAVVLPSCEVEADLDKEQRLSSVYISGVIPPQQAEKQVVATSLSSAHRLVRLGDLRRIFGEGKIGPARLTLQEANRRYPVMFTYLSSPPNREVHIRASIPKPEYTDSTMVDTIFLDVYE